MPKNDDMAQQMKENYVELLGIIEELVGRRLSDQERVELAIAVGLDHGYRVAKK